MQDHSVLAIALLLNFLCQARAQLAPAIYVFGDSTVDAGNNNFLPTVVRANFPPYGRDFDSSVATGRFCNGRTSTDYLANLVGLPYAPAYLDPQAQGSSIVRGVNFATSGSGFYEKTAVPFNVPGLSGQIEWFSKYKSKLIGMVGQANASDIVSKALVAISTGSNDYINNYYLNPLTQKMFDPDTYRAMLIESFANFVKDLYGLGARRIAVVSLAPLGCVPSQVTLFNHGELQCVEDHNQDAVLFNAALQSTVNSIKDGFPGLRLAYVDIYTLFTNVLANPGKYGFQQTLTGCCGTGRLEVSILCNMHSPGTCTDASKYVFWDSFHPTDAMNKLIANAALSQGAPQLL
ncbi:hypothetical protein SELMODRAFT_438768 [Selaginella moellendorffii]|uniref:Uncharacterized protein n=1 Tax=Selaginella moellendorffii TaxID=88036 RepID=D8QZ87_SELML|nr:GDSL esterase/lipase At5g03810 [Selaginella moellendorffii]EFJ34368.1 hypothetical protein SELMODRAFT_438768 [Selaginella moellendorffii]|eukprot:XP_002964035.1 GDSL esterase/lipase At5g03810 [Selaginella moellendorffii]